MTRSLKIALAMALLAGLPATASAAPASAAPERCAKLHQLRIYRVPPRNREAFHARFRDHAARIMARHGFTIRAMWEARAKGRLEFVYLLEWPDEATLKARWAAFMADEEWAEIKRRTAARHGTFVESIEDRTMCLVGYSPGL
jgi:hypothetical protein